MSRIPCRKFAIDYVKSPIDTISKDGKINIPKVINNFFTLFFLNPKGLKPKRVRRRVCLDFWIESKDY